MTQWRGPNALSVDVEEWFQGHLALYRDTAGAVSRVRLNLEQTLAKLDEHGVRATFYVVGSLAAANPEIVPAIVGAGHEVGCHGWEHRLQYELEPDQFRRDTRRALDVLSEQAGAPVRAYRAPTWSITRRNTWALPILVDEGVQIDSSLFPGRNHLYGVDGIPLQPFRIGLPDGRELLEFPPTTWRVLGLRIPVGGSFYLRALPGRFVRAGLRAVVGAGRPLMLYYHSWESDLGRPRHRGSPFADFVHYVNTGRFEQRLDALLSRFPFDAVGGVLSRYAEQHVLPRVELDAVG